jgi:hypothetical protein
VGKQFASRFLGWDANSVPYRFDRKIDISFSTREIIFHGGHPAIIVALNLRACQTQLKNSRPVSR